MKFYQTSIGKYFMFFSYCMILVIALVFRLISTDAIRTSKIEDTKNLLRTLSVGLEKSYELLDTEQKGFYQIGDQLYIGNEEINDSTFLIDQMKKDSGVDFTIFAEDCRIATTITKENGERYTNTKASDIWTSQLQYGKEYFDENISINNISYLGYYTPMKDIDGNVIGMFFAGLPMESIENTLQSMGKKMFITCLLVCIAAFFIISIVTSRFLKYQNGLMTYLTEIDDGNFTHTMPEWITKRNDEFGILGRHIIAINNSLSNTIEKDSLTQIYNRRAAMKHLDQYFKKANTTDDSTFTFAIGDIDFFKKVNDTYGHNCGDVVLKRVAAILDEGTKDMGFVARWGGEEFILVFEDKLQPSLERLEQILNQIRNEVIVCDDKEISITMTFGIIQYKAPQKVDWMISYADKLLYYGKEHGRNQIVSHTKLKQ
ncbi:MAG: diguanylate cyclase [Eubacteriales bacterium]|nr:diguanylate cyclase [Eubacteriales bacterium]